MLITNSILRERKNDYEGPITKAVMEFFSVVFEALNELKESEEKNEITIVKGKTEESSEDTLDNNVNDYYMSVSDDNLSENFESAIKGLNCANDEDSKLIKLTISTMLWCINQISTNQLINQIKSIPDAEFVNTVSKFISDTIPFIKMNTFEIYDMISLDKIKRIMDFEYEYYPKFEEWDGIKEIFREKYSFYKKKEMEAAGVENPDPVVPVYFSSSKMTIPDPTSSPFAPIPENHIVRSSRRSNLSVAVINKLEGLIGDIIPYDHQFNKIGDVYELVTEYNGSYNSYIIDPGQIMGNGYGVKCNYQDYRSGNIDDIFVSVKHKDILKKVFTNPLYILTPDEAQKVFLDYLPEMNIYRFIDMNKAAEFLPKLTQDEKMILNRKLASIIYANLFTGYPEVPFGTPRLRFRSFKSVNDFVLISDNKCKSAITDCSDVIIDGVIIKVKENGFNLRFSDDTTNKGVDYEFVLDSRGDIGGVKI